MKHDQRGISLVEIIVTIAVASILMGASFSMFGAINYANAKKAAETIGDTLDSQRVVSMAKAGKSYLYIYRTPEGYYMKVMDQKLNGYSEADLETGGTKISNGNVQIYYVPSGSATGDPVLLGTRSGLIRITYNRAGVFTTDTNVSDIYVTNKKTYTISLASETGKHYID